MGRFLMFFSYIGTQYSGVAIQNIGGCLRTEIKTVQGVLHTCLEKLKPANDVKIYTSSRTDAGVHALCNSLHFDLQHRFYPERDYEAEMIMTSVNRILRKAGEYIRVLKVLRVSDNFHCRHKARSRQYVYRLCFIKDAHRHSLRFSSTLDKDISSRRLYLKLPVPPMEFNTSFCVMPKVDVLKLHEAANVLTGLHDFSAFTSPKSLSQNDPVKCLTVGVKRSTGILAHYQPKMADCFDFWEVHFHSQSFLYRQVRRMVGTMLKVGEGVMDTDELQHLLDHPPGDRSISSNSQWSVPPHGLFLKSVVYNPEDLEYDASVTSDKTDETATDLSEQSMGES